MMKCPLHIHYVKENCFSRPDIYNHNINTTTLMPAK